MNIRSSFFVMMHNTKRGKNENEYLQIQRYFRIELRPEKNVLSVMEIKIVSYSTQSLL